MTGVVEGAGSDLVVVSGDKEFAGLSLDLLILLQSDDCCHSGEHWDVCRQQTQPIQCSKAIIQTSVIRNSCSCC